MWKHLSKLAFWLVLSSVFDFHVEIGVDFVTVGSKDTIRLTSRLNNIILLVPTNTCIPGHAINFVKVPMFFTVNQSHLND